MTRVRSKTVGFYYTHIHDVFECIVFEKYISDTFVTLFEQTLDNTDRDLYRLKNRLLIATGHRHQSDRVGVFTKHNSYKLHLREYTHTHSTHERADDHANIRRDDNMTIDRYDANGIRTLRL